MIIHSIDFYTPQDQFLFSVNEYSNFLDAELVIEQSEDENYYYYQIQNVKIINPLQVDIIWNSYYSYKVKINTQFGIFDGYVDLNNIEKIENYLFIKINFDTINKVISDAKAILIPFRPKQIYVRYEAGLGNYPITSLILACVNFIASFRGEVKSVVDYLTIQTALSANPTTSPSGLFYSALKIIQIIYSKAVSNFKFFAQLKMIERILDFITQKYNCVSLEEIVNELSNYNIQTNILDFAPKNLYFLFRTRNLLLSDVLKIIQKIYNKVITITTKDFVTYIRFLDKTDINYTNKSYVKNYKKENYMLANITVVSFAEDKTNFYTHLDQRFANNYTKYIKVIENASKSIKIDIDADLALNKTKKSAEDIIMDFVKVFAHMYFVIEIVNFFYILSGVSIFSPQSVFVISITLPFFIAFYLYFLVLLSKYNPFLNKIVTASVTSNILLSIIDKIRYDPNKNVIYDYYAKERSLLLDAVKNSYTKNFYKQKYKEIVPLKDSEVFSVIQNPVGVDKLVYNFYKKFGEVEAYKLVEVFPNVLRENFV